MLIKLICRLCLHEVEEHAQLLFALRHVQVAPTGKKLYQVETATHFARSGLGSASVQN